MELNHVNFCYYININQINTKQVMIRILWNGKIAVSNLIPIEMVANKIYFNVQICKLYLSFLDKAFAIIANIVQYKQPLKKYLCRHVSILNVR